MNKTEPISKQTNEQAEPELKQWLAQWEAPETPARLDAQVRASYRQHFPQWPWWQRWLTVSIRVPVPVVVAAGLVLCVMSWLAARQTASVVIQPAADTAQTKFVEVPIVQEKLVTRMIYARRSGSAQAKLKGQPGRELQLPPAAPANALQAELAGFRPVSEIKIEVNP